MSPIDARPLVEQIHNELKGRIFSGDWPLGSRIYEEELAHEFEVSRASVREALRFLEHEGLVIRSPHRGLFVSAPSRDEIFDVACLRALLEAYAVRWGRPIDATLLGRLEAILERMERAERDGDFLEAITTDLDFHAEIVAQSDNAALVRKYRELDGYIAIFFHAVMTKGKESLPGITARHRPIIAALSSGDWVAITRTIEGHYQSSAMRLGYLAAGRSHDGSILTAPRA